MTLEEYLEKGRAAIEQEDWQIAREAFDAAIELEETSAPAWHGLGTILLREGELEQAVECYEYAFSQDDSLIPPWTALGHLAAQQEEDQAAIQFYKTAIQIAPHHSEPWNGLGIIYASKLGKPLEAARCFVRAEYLNRDRHINNTFTVFSQIPPQPFFSYRIIRDYMQPATYPKWKEYLTGALEEALPLMAFLSWQNLQIENGHTPPKDWEMWQGIIHFLMGDPSKAMTHLEKARTEKKGNALMIAYYQIQCAWDFVEPETSYIETALAMAENYLPQLKSSGWGPFAKKQAVAPPLSGDELLSCYYAGLIFIEDEDPKKALLCFERIEQDFLPAAYMALWLTEELVLPKKKKEKAEFLLQRENQERQFTEGISIYHLNADTAPFLQQLVFVNHYLELIDAIDTLHYYAEFEGDPREYEILMGKDQLPFYMLWALPDTVKEQFLKDFRSRFFLQIENGWGDQLAGIQANAREKSLESLFADAIDANELSTLSVRLLTAYFQYTDLLDAKTRSLLNLYAHLHTKENDLTPTQDNGTTPAEFTGDSYLFLLDGLTQPKELLAYGDLAEHAEAFRSSWETSPITFSDFREQLEKFIQNRPAPEPEVDTVTYDEISSEEE